MSDTSSIKTGYLDSDYRLFYLTSTEDRDFQSHYHDFHKLLFFQSGHLSYYIEGKTYELQPGDLVLVPAGKVHRPVIHDTTPYHRLILYLSSDFFQKIKEQGIDLFQCFSLYCENNAHVLRIPRLQESRLYRPLQELIRSCADIDFASAMYQRALLMQFLILLNRAALGNDISCPPAAGSNSQILLILSYINEHLTEELSIDQIASMCYLNRSYLMHLFRRETGYTLGTYIAEKRLFLARTLIQSGLSVTDAASRSGFSSYAAFYRAYQKKFQMSPGKSLHGSAGTRS